MQKPSIGRVVHYKKNGIANAALITRVTNDEMIDIHVFEAEGNSYGLLDVTYSEEDDCGWSWPPKI